MFTYELVRNFIILCGGGGRHKRFCMKVDLKKTFHKVDFLLLVLHDLGFNNTWIHIHRGSIWIMRTNCGSRAWNIISLREKLVHGCFYRISNSINTCTWLDPWLNHCPLIQRFGNRTMTNFGGNTSHTITSSIIDGAWLSHPTLQALKKS